MISPYPYWDVLESQICKTIPEIHHIKECIQLPGWLSLFAMFGVVITVTISVILVMEVAGWIFGGGLRTWLGGGSGRYYALLGAVTIVILAIIFG